MSRVSIIDYGIGNLLSVDRALKHIGADYDRITTAQDIDNADKILLPGVGAFASCIGALKDQGLVDAVQNFAQSGKFLLGICVGMQMLFDASEEYGEHAGLGLIKGRVQAIPCENLAGQPHKIPHIGWSTLIYNDAHCPLLRDIPAGTDMYFVHSYSATPDNSNVRIADNMYGGHSLCAFVQHNNIYGTQFHPEKSGPMGLHLLKNFIDL